MQFSALKSLARRALYRCGILHAYHRWSNAQNLTVCMFHRVLPEDDPRWSTAEDTYTVSDVIFENCLRFFKRHYSLVTLADVRAALKGSGRLPRCPLLVTFDDGWLDNYSVALPILRRHEIPATIFVASSVIDDPREIWSHDLIVNGWNTDAFNTRDFAEFRHAIGLAAPPPESGGWQPGVNVLDVLVAAARLDESSRDAFLKPLGEARHFAPPRQMLDQSSLESVAVDGLIEIGAHGHSHLPLTHVSHAAPEFEESKKRLEQITRRAAAQEIYSMSFPHGRYNGRLVTDALRAGFELLFTSDAVLNPMREKTGAIFGRIGIPSCNITDSRGAFAPDRLAVWLFPRKSIDLSRPEQSDSAAP